MTSEEVNAILDERIEYSSYSAQESFTLSDIMGEKDQIDQNKLLAAEIIEDDMFDDYFDDEGMFEEQTPQSTPVPQTKEPEQPAIHDKEDKEQANEELDKKDKQLQVQKQGPEMVKQEERKSQRKFDRCTQIQSKPLPPLSQIRNIAFIVLNNVTAAFDQTARGVGIPTVITSNSIKYLAIGTSFGNVVLFEVGNKGKTILGTAQNRKYGPITAICISQSGRYLVCGQQNGLITVWDLTTNSQIKKEMATETKIVKMLFCSENQFILADMEGNVFLFTIENYFWIKIKKDRLFDKSNSVFYDVKVHTLQTGIQVIVLCSLEQVLVATYKPKVEAIDKIIRPDDLIHSKVPNIEIGKTAVLYLHNPSNKHFQYNDVLCVSWGNHILVYKFMEGIRLEKLELVYRFSQETPIYNMEFISEGVLVTLDNQQTYRSFRLWINSGGGHQLLNHKVIPEEVLYQRFIRDRNNRFIKIFNNTIISCSFNPRQKELFFIGKNSIYRCRVYKWNEYISDLIVADDECELALKVCIQIYYGRLDIFLEPIVINDKTKKILYEVGKIYMKKKLETIEKIKLERARNMQQKDDLRNVKDEVQHTYECIIQYMLEIRCCNQLITTIYQEIILKKFRQQEYHHLFLDCLEPFILKGRLTSLPNKQMFQELTDYYMPKNKRQLVDNLIMFLNVETLDMFYQEAIDICSQNKLYRALAYVCSTHKDFVPPLTNLLNQIRINQDQGLNSAQESYYTMLKDYIVKLLGGCYINGISFDDSDLRMKKSLSNWLMCRQTFTFFTQNKVQAYRQDYFYFVEELIYLLSAKPNQEDYIHSELKHITVQQFHDRQVAALFIKISEAITLETDELKLIVKFSDRLLIEKYLPKYLHFYKTYHQQLGQFEDMKEFVKKCPQLHYFHHLLKANIKQERKSILQKVDLSAQDYNLNGQLTKYLLNKMKSQQILWDIEELLKIHSQNTMIFMLERFSLETVSQRILGIEDSTYRYLIVRNLLKKLRKQNSGGQKKQKIKKFHRKKAGNSYNPKTSSVMKSGGSFLSVPERQIDGESDTESVIEINQAEMMVSPNRKLSKEVMQFYIECLCRYKNQKRVYYELICNMNDYYDAVSELITIIKKYSLDSCLGLLYEAQKNYEQAYIHYQRVYRHFFFEENYKKLISYINCHGRFARRMFERMLTLTNLLGKDQRWMEILKTIISPLQEKSLRSHQKGKKDHLVCDDIEQVYSIPEQRVKYGFIKQLGEIIQECLINVSTRISIEAISQFIGEHRRVFSRMFVLEAFRATLVTYSNNARIYHIGNEMLIHNQVSTFQLIYQLLLKGFPPGLRCQQCKELFDEQNPCKSYSCGHSYHQICPSARSQAKSRVQYRRSSSLAAEGEANSRVLKNIFDRCPKCDYANTQGQEIMSNDPVLPDFHKQYEESILLKGMVGIVTIIPNMIVAIPESLTALGSLMRPIQEKILEPIEDEEVNTELDDQVLGFLAFTENLHELQQENDRFIQECGKYFDQVR